MSYTILIVCTGNTCRSPMAEGLLRSLIQKRFPDQADTILIRSAGTAAFDGDHAADHAVTVLHEHGIDLSGHIARKLTPDMIQKADLILVMTEHHQGAVIHLVPDAINKVRILHMDDPYGQSLDVYRACALQLASDLDAMLSDIEKEGHW